MATELQHYNRTSNPLCDFELVTISLNASRLGGSFAGDCRRPASNRHRRRRRVSDNLSRRWVCVFSLRFAGGRWSVQGCCQVLGSRSRHLLGLGFGRDDRVGQLVQRCRRGGVVLRLRLWRDRDRYLKFWSYETPA